MRGLIRRPPKQSSEIEVIKISKGTDVDGSECMDIEVHRLSQELDDSDVRNIGLQPLTNFIFDQSFV